jgi:hypothetical protein
MQCSPACHYFIPLGHKYSPQHSMSNTLSLHSSLNIRDQVSHPHKTTSKIIASLVQIFRFPNSICKRKNRAVPVTGHRSLQGCEMLRIPQCLDNQLTDGDKVVSLTHWPLLYSLCYSFLLEAEQTPGPSAAKRIR